ncbi:VWA domain-containing protein [bacterium]|nr:VWA domain-containing protein [bacterium]
MKRIILVLVLFGLISSTTLAQTDVLFILDASGSMTQVTGGTKQIDAAKQAITGALGEIPEGTPVGLRVYAHRVAQSDKQASCTDTELSVPLDKAAKSTISTTLAGINPKGYTPISYSLQQAKNDFPVARESEKIIILLSDGEETCGGNPEQTVKDLIASGFKVRVHTVGFNVNALAESQLKGVANVSGGTYFPAKNATELAAALRAATKQSFVIKKDKAIYGTEIRGGDSFETAVEIKPDVEYRLDHHQKPREYDYFKVSGTPGQGFELTIKTLEKGININGDKTTENDMPYFGAKFSGPDRTNISHEEIIGGKFAEKKIKAAVGTPGDYYVLIGSEYDGVNKDHATFKLTALNQGDLDSAKDAGDNIETALALEVNKRYKTNHLGGPDNSDTFSFNAKAGEQYFVGFIPGKETTGFFRVEVFDDYKQKVLEKSFGSGSGGKSDTFTIPSDGTYFVEYKLSYPEQAVQDYTLEVKSVTQTSAVESKVETVTEPQAKAEAQAVAEGNQQL